MSFGAPKGPQGPKAPRPRRTRALKPQEPIDDAKAAFAAALRLLGYRARSRQELHQRLVQKGYTEGAADAAIARAEAAGFIDDRAHAQRLGQRAQQTKLLGARGARFYLRRMGIEEAQAEEALREYDEEGAARRLAEKKLASMKGLPEEVKRKRLASALGRRGFSSTTVSRCLRESKEAGGSKEED